MAFTLFGFQDFFREGITSNIELGTKKEQNTYTSAYTYQPSITRNYDVAYNIASGGSSISTKKEQSVAQSPTASPSFSIIPIQSGSASTGSGSASQGNENFLTMLTDNLTGVAVFGVIGFVAYKLLAKKK